eukprot:6210841-Pleurochrysis_carterae.AAC.1
MRLRVPLHAFPRAYDTRNALRVKRTARRRRRFPEQWIERTFALCAVCNGVTAIAAGFLAQVAAGEQAVSRVRNGDSLVWRRKMFGVKIRDFNVSLCWGD